MQKRRVLAALALVAALTASCDRSTSPSSRAPSASASSPTRLVGAHRIALAVPTDWKTSVERGAFCATIAPKTVQFFAPIRHGGAGSCAIPRGVSWPAEDSVSIYTRSTGGITSPGGAPAGKGAGMPYYISNSRQYGPGVALTLTVPRAGVAFLVGARTRDEATALLATIRRVPTGTPLR